MKRHLDIKKFSKIIQALIKFRSNTTTIKIGDVGWEELIWATLVFMFGEENVNWKSSSHEKSVDIRVKIDGKLLKISAKGGKIQDGLLTISSYRLTTFNDLKGKLEFIKNQHKNFDFYLICAKEIKNKKITYHVIKASPDRLAPVWLLNKNNWTQKQSAHELRRDFSFDAKIVFKMSNQLWYSIPLNYFLSKEKIITTSIPLDKLGKGLIDFLKSEFHQ